MSLKKICARCGKPFEPCEEYHLLCGEDISNCFGEVDWYGSGKLWQAMSILLNGKWTREELADLANSAAWDSFVTEVMREKDYQTRLNWLHAQIKEITD